MQADPFVYLFGSSRTDSGMASMSLASAAETAPVDTVVVYNFGAIITPSSLDEIFANTVASAVS